MHCLCKMVFLREESTFNVILSTLSVFKVIVIVIIIVIVIAIVIAIVIVIVIE